VGLSASESARIDAELAPLERPLQDRVVGEIVAEASAQAPPEAAFASA
jgi:hypothetical protein